MQIWPPNNISFYSNFNWLKPTLTNVAKKMAIYLAKVYCVYSITEKCGEKEI